MPANTMYTQEEISKYKYYLKELKDLKVKYPKSLAIHNGIVELERRLGLPPTLAKQSIDILNELWNN
ncbi:MAG: hypothetical protein ACRCZ9_09560 [Fusobacteriaceae bacterium]